MPAAYEIPLIDSQTEGTGGGPRDPEQIWATPGMDGDTMFTADIKHMRVVLSSEAEPNRAGAPTRPQPRL